MSMKLILNYMKLNFSVLFVKHFQVYCIDLSDGFSRLMRCQDLEIKSCNRNAIYLDTKLLQSRQFFKQTWQERRQEYTLDHICIGLILKTFTLKLSTDNIRICPYPAKSWFESYTKFLIEFI